ncbi:MAG: translocation/assembly module TamB, partial [Pseudomonadota bacterium]
LDLRFARTDEALNVALRVAEPGGGVLAEALDLPGRPSVALSVAGSGPLDAFAADLTLATDGVQRLSGDVTIRADGAARAFSADVSGDIRPLLQPVARTFFGPQTRLALSGLAEGDGALTLDDLSIRTAQFQADGGLRLDADGAPEQLDFAVDIQGDGPVRLPGTNVEL